MKKRIIIADDAALARMFIRKCLAISGLSDAEFIDAENGEAVLKLLENITPDLLITDLYMPVVDGFDLIQQIKSKENLKSMPIIVITSAGSEQQREDLVKLGVSQIISKPIQPPLISQAITKIFPNLLEEQDGYA